MEVDPHYEAHGVAQASRAVNVDIFDSDARVSAKTVSGAWYLLCGG
jgi:hypothetical protein